MKYKHEQKNRIEARVTRSMTSRKELYGNKVSVKKMNVKRYEKDVVQDCPKLFDTNEKHKTFSLPDIVQAVEWYQKNRTLLKSKKRNKTKNVYEYINHRTLDNLLPAVRFESVERYDWNDESETDRCRTRPVSRTRPVVGRRLQSYPDHR